MPDLGAPTSYLTLSTGVPVFASDGAEVGSVAHVLFDEEEDIFDGLVLDCRHGHRFADAPDVAELYERGVELSIDAAAVARLPAPTPSPGTMEVDSDDVESPLRTKLHRAWDRISGNY